MKFTLTILAVVAAASACSHSQPRNAPFRTRPDSTAPGLLVGPYSGQVLDAASGDPVSGAVVYASWSYQAGTSTAQATGYRESIASTDANGRYAIPKVEYAKDEKGETSGLPTGRLTDFHLVVYKRGYVAYRSDRRFDDFGPRRDFAQRLNEISLRRWNSTQSHARHLRYIGGGGPLVALTDWEREAAGNELSGTKREGISSDIVSVRSVENVIAAQLLGELEIKKITKFDGTFESGPLGDEADTNSYSSQHFKALGQPEVFDVALRLWRLGPDNAKQTSDRFEELVRTLPGVKELPTTELALEISDRSLVAVEGDIQGIAFMDNTRGLVVLLTCGKGQCSELSHLSDMAVKVFENIQAVMPLGEGQ